MKTEKRKRTLNEKGTQMLVETWIKPIFLELFSVISEELKLSDIWSTSAEAYLAWRQQGLV